MVETILGILNLILKREIAFKTKNQRRRGRKLPFTSKLLKIKEKANN
jgi:hypothetical protein